MDTGSKTSLGSTLKKTMLILSIILFSVGTIALLKEYSERYDEFKREFQSTFYRGPAANIGFIVFESILFFYSRLHFLIPWMPLILAVGILLTLHALQWNGKLSKPELITGIALQAFCAMTGNSSRLMMGTSTLSFASMDVALLLLIIYVVEVKRGFTRLGAYPFAFLLLIQQQNFALSRYASNYYYGEVKNFGGHHNTMFAYSGISLIQAILLVTLAFLIPMLRHSYLGGGSGVSLKYETEKVRKTGLVKIDLLITFMYLAYAVYLMIFSQNIAILD